MWQPPLTLNVRGAMSLIPLLLISVIAVVSYGLLFKLAAFLFKRSRLKWADSFVFGLLILIVSFCARAAVVAVLPDAGPLTISVVGLSLCLGLGGWFFGIRARNSVGAQLGWGGGLLLTGTGFVLLLAVGLAILYAAKVLRHL